MAIARSAVMPRAAIGLVILATIGLCGSVQAAVPVPAMKSDSISGYNPITSEADFVRRNVFIPMRDGVRLYTVILMKKGTSGAPILLTRTPYGADGHVRVSSQHLAEDLAPWNAAFVNDDYIRVFQDIRGRHQSQGVFVENRPLRGPLNSTSVDESTDAYDTIEWLSKHVPESNGHVAVIGASYDGWLTLMATINPSPALKAVVAVNPMVDLWMGDDWFHYGAFRQVTLVAIPSIMAGRNGGGVIASGDQDRYSLFLRAGSAGSYIRKYGLDEFPYTRELMAHSAYDSWWRDQALDKLLAKHPVKVPMLLVAGQWDEQDIYGATAVYRALNSEDRHEDKIYLALGPWSHGGALYSDGRSLGALQFDSDTARQFRRDDMKPFLDEMLKEGGSRVSIPKFLAYESGADTWEALGGIPRTSEVPFYLHAGFALSTSRATAVESCSDEYISDPAKPVPSAPRPFLGRRDWQTSLVADQRFASDRTDVLTYETGPLSAPVHVVGSPKVDLFASTTGTDSDWVVKLIDVYPDEYSEQPDMAGYELGVSMDIFRGRYLHGYDQPKPLPPDGIERYRFNLPMTDHLFQRGHRIMVQIQSSWFPIYDRNPQTFVQNIFNAKAADYRKATQHVFRDANHPSSVILPVIR